MPAVSEERARGADLAPLCVGAQVTDEPGQIFH